jgi:membrane-associated phospholipid phosphatase
MFGIIFSYIGIIPTFVGWSFLGASIFYLSQKHIDDIKKRKWIKAFAVLLFVLSFFYFCNTLYMSNANAFKVNFLIAYLIGIAVICAAGYLGYKLSKMSDNEDLLKKVLLLAYVSLVTLIIISCTKEIMCRPRFRFVLAMDNADYFRSWWQSGRSLKESLAAGAVTDEFSSLPSGHSAYSVFAIFIFPAFADYIRRLEKFRPHLFVFGFVWWVATALSRLTVGAHYLTDVAIAGIVTVFSYIIVSFVNRIYAKRKNTDKK